MNLFPYIQKIKSDLYSRVLRPKCPATMGPLLKSCMLAMSLAGAAELSDMEALMAEVRALRSEVASQRERLAASERQEMELARRLQSTNATVQITHSTEYVNETAFKQQSDRLKALEATSFSHEGAMDSIWILLCGALVMFMHAGFAMLETGCCRVKNAQNVLMKNMVNVCVGTLGWWICGWAFAYGSEGNPAGGFIGVREFAATGFLTFKDGEIVPLADGQRQSKALQWFFQWAFCTAGATIVSGGVAERVKSPSYAFFALFMAGFIYPVVAAWTWGGGWLSKFQDVGFMDFAGSGVVHLCGGTAALAGTVVLGPRTGRWEDPEAFEPHSLPLVVLGTFALWFGWYGFNPGSTLALHDAETGALAAQVAMNSTLSAATGGMTVFLLRYAMMKKYDVGGLCNGILAGLVSITAGAANVEANSAFIIGLVGAFVYQGASMALVRMRVDDPVDAVPVHACCGAWACFAAALFDWGNGLDYYHGWKGWKCYPNADGTGCMSGAAGKGLLAQLVLVLTVVLWSGTWATIAFIVLRKTGLLRVSVEVEAAGIDSMSHSPPKAYQMEAPAGSTLILSA
eukprot:TRINITY_DN8640_c0_g1_i7.p1 TRINITY_DN8640_c0_g1~~TRINITY_DN8640_c0_g1_i7.p1  ORF type:complete len:572 (+),score=93.39 TRINITY_DN8640_c0_g1_i7:21-1736(+)